MKSSAANIHTLKWNTGNEKSLACRQRKENSMEEQLDKPSTEHEYSAQL